MPVFRLLRPALPLLLSLLLAASCQPAAPGAPPLGRALRPLHGTWLHSREEDHADTLVYRPNTYKFPPARGRTGFAIGVGGRFTQFDIAPTDGLVGRSGTWTLLPGSRVRVQLGGADSSRYELVILKLEGRKLSLRREPAP